MIRGSVLLNPFGRVLAPETSGIDKTHGVIIVFIVVKIHSNTLVLSSSKVYWLSFDPGLSRLLLKHWFSALLVACW